MYNIVIYPYDETLKKTLQHINQKEYHVKGIVSPRGWGYDSDSVVIGNEEIKVSVSFDQIESEYDSICFVNSRYKPDFEKSILPILYKCKEKNMDVIVCRDFSARELKKIRSYIDKEKLHILYEKESEIEMGSEIYEIDIPVIFVADALAGLNSQDIQLDIYNELKKRGLNIVLVSSKRDMRLIDGVDTVPQFVVDECGSNKEKIVKFNNFIKQVEIRENPELIIMGVPGNIIEISKKVIGDFGSSAYIISKGVSPDYVICNFPYFPDFTDKYEELKEYIKNRIETEVDVCNVVTQYLDLMESEECGEWEYLGLSAEFVKRKVISNDNIFFLCDKYEIIRVADEIIGKLESYAEIGIM